MKVFYDPSIVFQTLLPDYLWRTRNGQILITFDDGPLPGVTEIALKILAENNLHALFFLLGENFQRNKNLAAEIVSEGHCIGLHMFNHKLLWLKTSEKISMEISDFKKQIQDSLSFTPKYFRPPHGIFKPGLNSILSKQNLKNVMWSLLTKDYNNDFKVVKFALTKFLTHNSIVVFHDRIENKAIIKDSINYLIEHTSKNNFTIGKVSDCLK